MASTDAEFESRLAEHRGIVLKIASTYGRGHADRADLAQEIALQLWRAWPSYDRGRRLSTWMYRVALNTALTWARGARLRSRHMVELDAANVEPQADAPRVDDVDHVYRLLQTLPEMERALVLLHLEERSHREIAEVLGISETNVGTKLSRAKQKLRRALGEGA